MNKQRLLMISPVTPNATGGGPAMRAYQVLKAFAEKYEVSLLIPDFGYCRLPISEKIALMSQRIAHYDLNPYKNLNALAQSVCFKAFPQIYFNLFAKPSDWRFISGGRISRACASFIGDRFDVIHIYRLYAAPFAEPFLSSSFSGFVQLDLDDIESLTRFRIGELYAMNGDRRREKIMKTDAAQYSKIERELLPRFDRALVCSETDKETIQNAYGCRNVGVVPNTVDIELRAQRRESADLFTVLFVGAFSYYPNQDGIEFFCNKALPLIRKRSKKPVRVKIVGGNMPASSAVKLKRLPEVELIGWVEDLRSCYEDSDAVIAPIRAGGGTRIKVLEAFSYKRPVIATSIGAEGIAAEHGKEILLGDGAEEFAERVVQLMEDADLRSSLAENGYRLLKTVYNPERIKERLLNFSSAR